MLTRRLPDAPDFAGHWEVPGGKVEPGETPEQALARELMEELGVEVEVEPEFWRCLERRDHGPDIDFRVHPCRILRGSVRPLQVADLGWFSYEAMAELDLPPLDQQLLIVLRDA